MSISKVTRNYQITIPASVRQVLRIRIGSLVDFVVQKGAVLLKPKILVDEDQAWFWTKEWQEDEKRVDEEIKKGHLRRFRSVREARKHFEK